MLGFYVDIMVDMFIYYELVDVGFLLVFVNGYFFSIVVF